MSLSVPPDPRLGFLVAQPFAHRGLHGGGVVENSRAAFRAAIALGHGIETDVQAARDGTAMVFHDATLERLTDATGAVAARSAEALAAITLRGTQEGIPSLVEILSLVAGRAPLLIEVKSNGRRVEALCRSVDAALRPYVGPVAIMSFNPLVGGWFRKHAPQTVRGLVVTEERKRNLGGFIERRIAMRTAAPHFLAYDVRDLPSRFAGAARRRGLPVLTWTVRTLGDAAQAHAHADQAIYEQQS